MMMNWKKARGGAYLLALAIGTGAVAAGYATFDPLTGTIDIAPFNLFTALALGWSVTGAPLLAFVALIKGWGK